MLSETANEARLLPLQQIAKSRLSQLKINGKRSIFDHCGLESELRRLLLTQNDQRAIMCDDKLQDEAASILLRAETCSPKPSKYCADFLIRAVLTSKLWIEPFRRRLRPLSNVSVEYEAGYTPLDANACITSCLEDSNVTNSLHVEAAGTVEAGDLVLNEEDKSQAIGRVSLPGSNSVHPSNVDEENANPNQQPSFTVMRTSGNTNIRQDIHGPFLLNDHNSYTRLAAGLSRFVGATMSPNNPNRHVPTDEELRYQARWMWFNE